MAALIALQLRICWRGLPQVLRVLGILILIMLLGYFSKRSSGRESAFSLIAIPLVLIPVGALLAIGSSDPLIWQVPLRRSARVWARVLLLALSGAFAAAFIAGGFLTHGDPPAEPWPMLLANLELSWLAGGLLLLLAGDLVRRSHVLVQAIVIVLAISPTAVVVALHLLTGLPWPALAAEAFAVLAFLALNLHVNRDLEFTPPQTGARTESPRDVAAAPGESLRLSDRAPRLASALLRAQYASVLNWVFAVLGIALSLLPSGSVFCYGILLPLFVTRILAAWRPFQATPAPRGKAMAVLFLPLLGLWVLTLSLQCLMVGTWKDSLFTGSLTGFRLPMLTREVPSTDLTGRLTTLPPARVAELVRDAFRTAYGLDVPVSEILALQTQPESREGWLLAVDARWAPDVQKRELQWRLLLGAMGLAWGMLSFVTLLPGRWPRWISKYLFLFFYLLIVLPSFFKGDRSVVAFIPEPLLPLYQTAFDRPWILIAAFMAFSSAFLVRNYLVFKSSELEPELGKAPA